jgi:hypothetical protein
MSGKFHRSLRGICFLHAYLDNNQSYISYEAQIEHILPKKWNGYDAWTEETHTNDVNKLGNLVVLEKKLNISAKNEFFVRKQKEYKKSEVIEAQKLCNIPTWNPKALDKRHERVINDLVAFLSKSE